MFQGMEYVYAVYKEKSFSKAAKKLFISQPSLSANVKREEKNIGYPIFDRSTKPLSLTEPGKKYIETVESILSAQCAFKNYINDLGELKTGSLLIGGSSLYSSWILPSLMRNFASKYPHIKLELLEDTTTNLCKILQAGGINLLLDNFELDPFNFNKQLYRKEYLVLAVPKHFKINNGLEQFQLSASDIRSHSFLSDSVLPVDLSQFKNEPFLLLKQGNDTRIRAEELCRKHAFVPNIIFEADQQMTSYNITCSGMGIAFISDSLISNMPETSDVIYYKLSGKSSYRNVYFYWKKNTYFSKAMQVFLEEL